MADDHTEREAEVEQRDAPEVEQAAAPAAEPVAAEPVAAGGEVEPEAAVEPVAAADEVEPAAAATPVAATDEVAVVAAVEPLVAADSLAAVEPHASVDLAEEPDYPPPNSVPRPPPPSSLRVYQRAVVDDITPTRGPVLGDTKLTLVGANLFRASIVRIGGLIAQTIGADEPRELRVLTPGSDRPGEVDVTVENPHVAPTVLANAFRYEALAAPRIVSVAPDHVATKRRTELTVTGENFVKGTVVLFDGKPAESARFVSATTIDVTAPPGEHGKLVDVSVKNPDGATAVARRAFLYDERFG